MARCGGHQRATVFTGKKYSVSQYLEVQDGQGPAYTFSKSMRRGVQSMVDGGKLGTFLWVY